MIKVLKGISIAMIFLSLFFFAVGSVSSKLAEKNRGVEIPREFIQNGSYITAGGTFFADGDKVERFEAIAVVFYVSSVLLFCSGICVMMKYKKLKNAKIRRQYGIILEKETSKHGMYESIVVEFNDHSRKKLVIDAPVLLTEGDEGIFGYKNHFLVDFTKK